MLQIPQTRDGCTVLLTMILVLAVMASAGTLAAEDSIEVPGGRAAVARVLGIGEATPENFVARCTSALVATIDPRGRAVAEPSRQRLLHFLKVVEKLHREHGPMIVFTPDRAGFRRFAEVADDLGYRVKKRRKVLVVERRDQDGSKYDREVASALAWDLRMVAHRLDSGESVELELLTEEAASPLPLDLWARVADVPVGPATALRLLASDQPLGLVLDGFGRLDAATLEHLTPLARQLAPRGLALYTAAPFLTVRDGSVVVPGGLQMVERWQALVGAEVDQPQVFVAALLSEDKESLCRLFCALSGASDEVAMRLLESGRSLEGDPGPGAAVLDPGPLLRPTGANPAAVLRAVADIDELVEADPALWYQAVRLSEVFKDKSDVEALVRSSSVEGLSWRGLISRVLADGAGLQGVAGLARLLRSAGFFRQHPHLASEANLALIGRLGHRYRYSLRVLDVVEPQSSTLVEQYLLALARLDQLKGAPRLRALESFQAGATTVRILVSSGALSAARGEHALAGWTAIHGDSRRESELRHHQLRWLAETVEQVAAPAAWPGRGPLEKRLLAGVASVPEVVFTWHGLEYVGDAGLEAARRSSALLVGQGVAVIDELMAFADALEEVERARTSASGSEQSAWSVVVEQLRRLSKWRPIESHGPARIQMRSLITRAAMAAELLLTDPHRRELLGELEQLLGKETRVVLLAPVYLQAVAAGDEVRLPRGLIRRHRLDRGLEGVVTEGSPWLPASLVRTTLGPPEVFVSGHVDTVAAALTPVLRGDGGRSRGRAEVDRGAWFDAVLAWPWRGSRIMLTAPSPQLDGRGRPRAGSWPPFSALQVTGSMAEMEERFFVELRRAVAGYLERHALPAEVGQDLLRRILLRVGIDLPTANIRDWQPMAAWIRNLDDSYFDERMKECLVEGRYLARGL